MHSLWAPWTLLLLLAPALPAGTAAEADPAWPTVWFASEGARPGTGAAPVGPAYAAEACQGLAPSYHSCARSAQAGHWVVGFSAPRIDGTNAHGYVGTLELSLTGATTGQTFILTCHWVHADRAVVDLCSWNDEGPSGDETLAMDCRSRWPATSEPGGAGVWRCFLFVWDF